MLLLIFFIYIAVEKKNCKITLYKNKVYLKNIQNRNNGHM